MGEQQESCMLIHFIIKNTQRSAIEQQEKWCPIFLGGGQETQGKKEGEKERKGKGAA